MKHPIAAIIVVTWASLVAAPAAGDDKRPDEYSDDRGVSVDEGDPSGQAETPPGSADEEETAARAYREWKKTQEGSRSYLESKSRVVVTDTPNRLLGLSIDVNIGGFYPGDVNRYMDNQYSGATLASGFREIVLFFGIGLSMYIRPSPYLSIRPNFQTYLAPKVLDAGGSSESYLLWAVAPGLALDLVVNPRAKTQFFITQTTAYYHAGFEGMEGDGLGVGGGLGINILFGRTRKNGLRLTLLGRWAKAWTGHDFDLDFTGGLLMIGPIFNFGEGI